MTDLDDTSCCPREEVCACCHGDANLSTRTVESLVGVFCITLCAICVQVGDMPRLSVPAAVNAVLEHCGHLDITADQMAAALRSSHA